MNCSRFLFLLLFGLQALDQSMAQGFLHTYGPDSSLARTLLQTADDGYFITGRIGNAKDLFWFRADALGDTVWTRRFALNEARSVAACAAPDGGFIVLAENYVDTIQQRNIVVKLDSSGAIQWTQVVYNNNMANGLRDIICLSDSSIMAAGTTLDAGFNARNWLVKFAPDGTKLWGKTVGLAGNAIKKLMELPTGNIVLSGSKSKAYLAKVNENGDLLWENEYNQPDATNPVNYDLLVTAEGNIALLNTAQTAGRLSLSILKTDPDGNAFWFKNFYPFSGAGGIDPVPVVNAFGQDNAGNFYIPFWGFEDDPFDSDLELLKLSPNGDVLWKHPLNVSGNAWDIIQTSDNHLSIAGDNNGLPTLALLLKTDFEDDYLSNKITGRVFRDDDVDCAFGSGEPGLVEFIVRAKNQSGEEFYKKTNPDGSYEIRVTAGNFALTVFPSFAPSTLYAQCDTPTIAISGTSQTALAPDIGVQVLGECPLLSVEISGGLLRRCTTVVYNASWCNAGNLPAQNASLQIIKSPLLLYQSSTIPLAGQSGDTLTFTLGEISPGVCSSTNILFKVDCAAQFNEVLCAEAHIFPDSACAPPGLNWDGSVIEVSGSCNGSDIEFKVKNTGVGDMTQVLDYVIIEDQIMYLQAPIQLQANEEHSVLRIPMPQDSCFALQVFQNQTSILSRPVAVVANCLSTGNLNLLISLPNNENYPALAVHCDSVISSYDPNDKMGFPTGLTDAHYIEKDQDIEYRIRFQNTGNDTAFLITILDTLPSTLEPSSFRPIAASHPYTWDVTGKGVVTLTFANILLPDSTTNEPGSHGFISFRASQKPGLPDGTLIDNSASIYFDFNEAVLTNTWRHTIGRPKTVGTQMPKEHSKSFKVLVSPNPMSESSVFQIQGDLPASALHFKLLDPLGKTIRKKDFSGDTFVFEKKDLGAGIYFWQLESAEKTLARGRIVVK